MSELVSELQDIYSKLQAVMERLDKSEVAKPLDALEQSAKEVGKSWGHSWLGYQSRVYYHKLAAPPPGQHFSSEWGFIKGERETWVQFPEDAVETEIKRRAGNPDTTNAQVVTGHKLVMVS